MITELAKELAALAEQRDHVVVGPLVWYPAAEIGGYRDAGPDDDIWTTGVIVPPGKIISVQIGIVASEPDPEWFAAFDVVLTLRRPNEMTREAAKAQRQDLIAALRKEGFKKIHNGTDELDAAQLCARLWPSERFDKLVRAVMAEASAA